MKYLHPAFMAALFLLGYGVAGRGGPVRLARLGGREDPVAARRHRRPAVAFAALMAAGYGGGLLAVRALTPGLLFRSVHFQVGSILLGLLAAVVVGSWQAQRGRPWALHLHPLLATVLLLLYLVQAGVGLNLLGWAPGPPAAAAGGMPEAAPPPRPAALPDSAPPPDPGPAGAIRPLPDEPTVLRPRYAICPRKFALPALCWAVQI
jgi:hypothetical protein